MTRVAVVEPLEVVREALAAGLAGAGFDPVYAEDVAEWAAQPGQRAVLFSLVHPPDLKRLGALTRGRPDSPVVALMDEPGPEEYLAVLRAGAATAVDRAGDVGHVIRALEAALDGATLLPRAVAAALGAAGWPREELMVCPMEIRWLRAMASGVTVGTLARQEGHSLRDFFRLLHDLYQRMGVENRSQAIAQAARWGLLDQP